MGQGMFDFGNTSVYASSPQYFTGSQYSKVNVPKVVYDTDRQPAVYSYCKHAGANTTAQDGDYQ